MSVFVLGSDSKPIMPCSEKRARLLLERNRAKIIKMYPFTIQLKDRKLDNCKLQIIEVKIDPGSKVSGLCITRTVGKIVNILNLFELVHRGLLISKNLKVRAIMRRNRRNRNTRYRIARFFNRIKPLGWLTPSLMHRVDTVISTICRFQKYLPITNLSVERVKFDMQKLRNPEITGIEYQQGTLFQYDVKEYLLEKWGRKCVYCNATKIPLEIEHIVSKANHGTNSVSNLTISCRLCNIAKGNLPIEIFLLNKPELLKRIKSQLKKPLRDASAVNTTRNKLFTELLKLGLPVNIGTGSQTKFNRLRLGVPKTHALDAACVGNIEQVNNWKIPHIEIKCNGRGQYSRTILNKFGFPRLYLPKVKKIFGFATGDIVSTIIKLKEGLKKVYVRILIRTNGCSTFYYNKSIFNVNWKNCKLVQYNNGYSYFRKEYNFLNINNKLLTINY